MLWFRTLVVLGLPYFFFLFFSFVSARVVAPSRTQLRISFLGALAWISLEIVCWRLKRIHALLDVLYDSSDEDEPRSPSRKDAHGYHRRRGGWHPHARQNPDAMGLSKWWHDWRTSKLWKLLQRQETHDDDSYWGKFFRSCLRVPREIFDESSKRLAPSKRCQKTRSSKSQGITSSFRS